MNRTVHFASKPKAVFEYEPFPWFEYEEIWKKELETIYADRVEEDSDEELPESAFLCAVADPDVLHIPRLPNRRGITLSPHIFLSSCRRTQSAAPVSTIKSVTLSKLSDTAEETVGSTFLEAPSHSASGRSMSVNALTSVVPIDETEGDVTRRAGRSSLSMSFIDSSALGTENNKCAATQNYEECNIESFGGCDWRDDNSVGLGGLSAGVDSSEEVFTGSVTSLPIKLLHISHSASCEDTPSTTSSASTVGRSNALLF